jgi:MoaA/NifB/PqqE/SkfB family radical SAM enzyme
LDFFKNQLGTDTVQQIKKITFCGNDGDPIYCKDFLDICEWIKQVNPNIHLVLITNGSHKPTDWWQRLGEIFNINDEIHWSLDGWDQESNEQYRINSDWHSIVNGINSFNQVNTSTYRIWDSIAFKFNEKHLLKQKMSALAHGFDSYQLTKSTKFGSKYPAYGINDPLEPEDVQMIAPGHRFERIMQGLSTKHRPSNELKTVFLQRAENLGDYTGICLIGNKGVFLNSRGEFYPCCWTAGRYEHNRVWHERVKSRFNLNTRTFQDIIGDRFWTTEFLEFNSLECKTKCTPERLTDRQHTTEW